MATKKISELNALTTPDSNDLLAIVDTSATETKKITIENVSKHIINVGTSVEEDTRVNFIHSRNIIDSSNFQSGAISGSTGQKVEYGTRICTINKIPVEPSTKYAITINTTTSYSFLMIVDAYSQDGTYLGRISASNGNINGTYVQTQATAKYINITMRDTTDSQVLSSSFLQYLSNGSLQIQLVKGETSLDYEPYNISNQIVVDNEKFTDTIKVGTKVDGKSKVNFIHSRNLFETTATTQTINGITYTKNSDGTITANGTASANASIVLGKIKTDSSKSYYLSGCPSGGSQSTYTMYVSGSSPAINDFGSGVSISGTTFDNNLTFVVFSGKTVSNMVIKPMLIEGTSALPFEPYIVPSINVDGDECFYSNDYSTSEVKIGTWMGKPLYRKVIEVNTPTLDAWTNVNHNISNMDFGRIVDATITRVSSGTTSYIPIGIENVSSGSLFTCNLQKTIFQYKIAVYTNITKLTAVLEYTKTTD